MGHLGKITSIKVFLKAALLTSYIKHAMQLNNTGIKLKATKSVEKMPIAVPDYFAAAFNKNNTAAMVFEKFSPSHKKEYIQWIEQAKREHTRSRRIETALQEITEGKGRTWKYAQ